jgi:hypothetical protein
MSVAHHRQNLIESIRIFILLTGFHFSVCFVIGLFSRYLADVCVILHSHFWSMTCRCLCEAHLHMSEISDILFVFYRLLLAALFRQYLCLSCYSAEPLHRKMVYFFMFNVVLYWNGCNGSRLSLYCFSMVMISFSLLCFCYVLTGRKQAG